MTRHIKTPFFLIEMPKEEYDAFIRRIISNEVSIAVFDYMKQYNETPKHIDIYEKPRPTEFFETDIVRDLKTQMYKYRGELVSYSRMCEIIEEGRVKDYDIEVY